MSNIIPLHAEDWTGGEPVPSPNANLLAELRAAQREIRILRQEKQVLQQECARKTRIELNGRNVMAYVHAGQIDAHGPLACMAVVEFGASVGMPVTKVRT